MKLYEYLEFEDAIILAKEYFNQPKLTEQFIEKDYYVTEALRIISKGWGERIIFKGGTSLSKAWNLIERFSEDIDLYLNRDIDPPLSNSKVDTTLRDIQEAVGSYPKFRFLSKEDNGRSRSEKGLSRTSDFGYTSSFSGNQDIPARILLEMGVRSGSYPIATKQLSSLLAQYLNETNQLFGAEDENPFSMQILHFCRTFVEKLFAIHSHVIDAQKENKSIGTYARHYYDLFCLLKTAEVLEMLKSKNEYEQIKKDCNAISEKFFSTTYYPPQNLSFANSEAIFPTGEVRQMIMDAYNKQCKNLCYGEYPSWEQVEVRFIGIRNLL